MAHPQSNKKPRPFGVTTSQPVPPRKIGNFTPMETVMEVPPVTKKKFSAYEVKFNSLIPNNLKRSHPLKWIPCCYSI